MESFDIYKVLWQGNNKKSPKELLWDKKEKHMSNPMQIFILSILRFLLELVIH